MTLCICNFKQLSTSPARSALINVLENLRRTSPALVKQFLPVLDQLEPIYASMANGTQEFVPRPEETDQQLRSQYGEGTFGHPVDSRRLSCLGIFDCSAATEYLTAAQTPLACIQCHSCSAVWWQWYWSCAFPESHVWGRRRAAQPHYPLSE